MSESGEDYRYITGLIQLLDFRFGVRFFITSRDFDVLYRWWEKGIPIPVAAEAFAAVIERRRARGRPIAGFSAFSYEVKKRYQDFLALRDDAAMRTSAAATAESVIREFLTKYPDDLAPLRGQFEEYFGLVLAGEPSEADALRRALLDLFRADGELEAKTEFFLRNLAPALRRPELESTYRLNFLIRRYRIPFP